VRETGRISEIHGKMITVLCGEIAACFGCMNQECKSNKRMITAENPYHFDLSVGQFVEIERSVSGAFVQFLQALIPPLFGFFVAYFIVKFVFPISGDGIRAAAGFFGLLLAGFSVYFYRKKNPAKNNPRIMKILDNSAC
jgi:sigma-E factor negative regulatory protein RseC